MSIKFNKVYSIYSGHPKQMPGRRNRHSVGLFEMANEIRVITGLGEESK